MKITKVSYSQSVQVNPIQWDKASIEIELDDNSEISNVTEFAKKYCKDTLLKAHPHIAEQTSYFTAQYETIQNNR